MTGERSVLVASKQNAQQLRPAASESQPDLVAGIAESCRQGALGIHQHPSRKVSTTL